MQCILPQIKAATALNMPCLVTEQYPKALGITVQSIKDVLSDKTHLYAKLTFSMVGKSIGGYMHPTHRSHVCGPLGEETSAWWHKNSSIKQVPLMSTICHNVDYASKDTEQHAVWQPRFNHEL